MNEEKRGPQRNWKESMEPIKVFQMLACLIIGVAIGYLGGTMSQLATLSRQFGVDNIKVTTKQSTEWASSNSTTTSNGDRNPIHRPLQNILTQKSDMDIIVDEIIPKRLYPRYRYHPKTLPFNVTRSMLRQSRPVIGNVQRLQAYIEKLHSEQCTTVLFLGGSVTDGHNTWLGFDDSYAKFFIDWMNERYPCRKEDGTTGEHVSKRTKQNNSQTHFISWNHVSEIESFDLVVIEFNVNDSMINENPHTLEVKSSSLEYNSCWYSEVLLRRLLLLRKPDPVAVVTFNADYIGRPWTNEPHNNLESERKSLFRKNNEPLSFWISSMYQIPLISASAWLLPLAGKRGTSWQFNVTNPYGTKAFHSDRCCHPKRFGHVILSLVLAYCFVEEEKIMTTYGSSETMEIEHDFTADAIPVLRDPIYLSDEEEKMYVRRESDSYLIDFTDPSEDRIWNDAIAVNEGWSWYADNREKDKFGLIANDVSGGQHLSLEVFGGKHGLVEISYVISYENFGLSLVWIDDDRTSGKKEEELCLKETTGLIGSERGVEILVASWDEKASVPTVTVLRQRVKEGQPKFIHICLTPKSESRQGKENKFKLLSVRLY